MITVSKRLNPDDTPTYSAFEIGPHYLQCSSFEDSQVMKSLFLLNQTKLSFDFCNLLIEKIGAENKKMFTFMVLSLENS